MSNDTVILKFGGTSVGNGERMQQVSDIILQLSVHPVIVLSAMSGTKKSEGTTSRLLMACDEILKPNSQLYLQIVQQLEEDHVRNGRDALERVGASQELLDETVLNIQAECTKLRQFMVAAEVIDELSPRSRDFIISCGEKLSALIFTAVLKARGLKARYVSLEKLVKRKFDSRSIDQSFYDYMVDEIRLLFSKFSGEICVVTGYLGPIPGGILDTIGRGYTDLTAALVAVALKASELQIWKEVDGIFTADPRKVQKARKIDVITPEEAAELTYYGSEVIHPFTMEQVIRASIPIRIKNTFKPQGQGTVILPEGHPLNVQRTPSRKHPTAVTIKESVIVVNVHSNRKSVSHGFFAHIFLTLDKFGIVVDLIATSEVHVSMALNPSISKERLELALLELKKYGQADVHTDMAILSLVGRDMRNMVGVASQMFKTLASAQVNIEMISQGASEINISCVISEEEAAMALEKVHDALVLGIQ
ncbi:Aspartate/glutamate/uridylate kinase [Gorgonomyces haynaldii]|nr:Aspartate/glutamate/uridylate kinase [Gorgonomyces haynaldii]